jgi:hypothetical protein
MPRTSGPLVAIALALPRVAGLRLIPAVVHAQTLSTRGSSASSLVERIFRPARSPSSSIFDSQFSLLPRLIEEEFSSALDTLNRAVSGLIRVEKDGDAIKVKFDDLGLFENVNVDFESKTNVLTVRAWRGEGNTREEMLRSVTMPCEVSKPELLVAETLDGQVVITIPAEAQAPNPQAALPKNSKLEIIMIGEAGAPKEEQGKVETDASQTKVEV